MAEAATHHSPSSSQPQPPPPPAPPLPPGRTVLQRIIAPLSFNLGTRPLGSHSTQSSNPSPRHVSPGHMHKQLPSQTTAHRTGIPISALDLNKDKTHAILAGQEILKTVRIHEGRIIEDFNLRSAINSTSSYGPRPDAANHRREYLPAKDVRWSHGAKYDTIVATAALNGRISIYDVTRLNSSRVELSWIHDHTGQVQKLDFDPFGGYLLLSGSQDKTVKIWDIRDPKAVLKKSTIVVRHPVRDLKWSPTDAGEFALCTESGIVQRWDLRKPSQALLSINAHEKACYTIDWHPDGRHVVSGGLDKLVKVWDFKGENKRPKPAFQLRTPQAVMNLAWRPACWSSESTGTGSWQCTQLATSYNDDDPRVHVWDLRRPLLPFRELDRYNSRPTDLTWASKDILWTVGYEGMFTQTDVRYAPQVHDELSPCAMDFMPDGRFLTFSEDSRARPGPGFEDAAAGFLKIPYERLSGTIDGGISRSVSDDDAEELLVNSSRKSQSKTASARSTKSQGNTPPRSDGFPNILSLVQSVPESQDFFNNEQMGTLSNITGIAAEPDIVRFLATNYARPSTVEQRKEEPSTILQRLEAAFMHNADICDYVSMHRMAQSWRILCMVVIPELREWADRNRQERLENEAKLNIPNLSLNSESLSPDQIAQPKLTTRSGKIASNFFKGIMSSKASHAESETTSNMTTPLAMPLPDSPRSRKGEGQYLSLNEIIEPMMPLPPAVVNSHSTASAASKALADDDLVDPTSPHSSPEKLRQPDSPQKQHKRSVTDSLTPSKDNTTGSRSPLPRPIPTGSVSPSTHIASPRRPLTEEDRRAAMRDYRAQARPLFTLESSAVSPRYSERVRHDSADSFPMFSASTDSSHKLPSIGLSFDSIKRPENARQDSDEWQSIRRDDLEKSPPSGESNVKQEREHGSQKNSGDSKDSDDFVMDDTPEFSFGMDEVPPSARPPMKPKVSGSAKLWVIEDFEGRAATEQSESSASSASEHMFHFEQVQAAPKMKIYASNPIRRMMSKTEASALQSMTEQDFDVRQDNVASKNYVYSDFRPVDFTAYEPKLPFAWSALPLVCHAIAFDVDGGIACAQFSVHLLMHLHPFFFNQAFRMPLSAPLPAPDVLSERLMRPDISHRVIEGLFANHLTYLKQLSLHGPMAELRLMCVEFDMPAVYKAGRSDQPVGSTLKQDPYQLQVSCSNCHAIMLPGTYTCHTCYKLREACPICLLVHLDPDLHTGRLNDGMLTPSNLWTFCQACGHGAHLHCMEQWVVQPATDGECPTTGCGCDCSPGSLRQHRIARQAAQATNNEMILGAKGNPIVTKRDPKKASPSPAVEKTRDALRNADVRENGTNGEEYRRPSLSGRGSGSSRSVFDPSRNGSRGGRDSFGNRRVRLVTPGEREEDK